MADAQFTPVDHDPFNMRGNAPGFAGALAHYIVPGMIGAQMAGQDTANLVKGIAHNIGMYGRALQGENIPLDDLIDASNTIAGLVATGGLGASAPAGSLGANILKYSKQDLLAHIEPSLQDKASTIFDTMQKQGMDHYNAASSLASKGDFASMTAEDYINHIDAAHALMKSANKLSSSVSLASTAKQDLLSNIAPKFQNKAGDIYDLMQKEGLNHTEAAYKLAEKENPQHATENYKDNYSDPVNALKASTAAKAPIYNLTPYTQNILKYSKQDLLDNIPTDLKEKAGSVYDTIVLKGLNPSEAVAHLISDNSSWENYINHTSAATALTNSVNKLSSISPHSALTPIKWQDYIPPDVGKAGSDWLRANPEVANLLFAKKAGFNTNVPLYKGMSHPLEGEGFLPAYSTSSEPALFFATEPDVAAVYSAAPGKMSDSDWYRSPSSILAYARAQNPFQVDWGGVYTSRKMNTILKDAKARNADLLAIHNINDIAEPAARPQTQIAVLDPSILRSPWAQFDPNRLHESDLLASRGLPLFIPIDHDPFASQQQ